MNRKQGLKIILRTILRNIFSRERSVIFEKAIDAAPLKVEAKVEVDTKLVQSDDIPKFPKRHKNIEIEAEERFAMGNMCFGAYVNGEMVHYKWVAFSKSIPKYSELERNIRISPDSAYIYDGFTIPEYRGLGISPKVMEKTLQHLSELGIKKVYSYVAPNNFAMLRVKQKEGFQKIGIVTYIWMFGLRLERIEAEKDEDYRKLKLMLSHEASRFHDKEY